MKIAHVYVQVKDFEASIESYQKAFGFEGSRRRGFPENRLTPVYLTLPRDDYKLELTYNYNHGAYNLRDGYGHIAIVANDLEKLHEQHEAAGLETTDLKGLPGTAPSYYFAINPDGYKIEIIRG